MKEYKKEILLGFLIAPLWWAIFFILIVAFI